MSRSTGTTRALAGEVGDLAVIARKTRCKNEWFIGAVGDEQDRHFDVPLSFLGKGRRRAEIYRDVIRESPARMDAAG